MWLARTTVPGGTFGAVGKFWWWLPTAATASDFTEIPVPSNINVVDLKETSAHYDGSLYINGGWTDNMVLTPDLAFWAQGIRPPTGIPDVAVGVGTLTASVICYYSWIDLETNERSPLSAASATLALTADGVQWSNLPTNPQNPRVTHIELWRSVDGSLPRLVMQRQIGVTSILESVEVGSLGEAFTEDFEKFPRCRYNVVWRDRQVMAGDDEHPDTIYLSLVGFPERKALSLRTKSGQSIVGLKIVRDTLMVGCERAWEVVTGYTEDDLAIEIVQPQIGLASQHSLRLIHGMMWVPNEIGFYVTDGAGWFFVGDDVQSKWGDEYKLNRDNYERSWAIHDPFDNVYMLYVGTHSDTGTLNAFWTGAYDKVVPLQGGQMGQPDWTYDTSTRVYHCGEVLYIPGSRRGDLYLGSNNGTIYKANNYDPDVTGSADDFSDTNAKRLRIRTGANFFQDYGGDYAHGKRFTEIDIFAKTELSGLTLNLYAGDEDAYPARSATKTFTMAASRAVSSDNYAFQPKWTWPFAPLVGVTGRALVVELTGASPQLVEIAGFQPYWKEGPAPRRESDEAVDPG
jgi:hypothetical protein